MNEYKHIILVNLYLLKESYTIKKSLIFCEIFLKSSQLELNTASTSFVLKH